MTAAPAAITVEVLLPDEIHDTYLEVRATKGHRVITTLEILSPTNKRKGTDGYREYRTAEFD